MVSLSLAWLMAKRLLDLVKVYTSHAASIAQGQYDLQWPPARTVEYSELGENLRSMAGQIHQRERQLRENERRLQELTANVPGVVFQLRANREHIYTSEFLSRKTIEIFGLDSNSETFIDDFLCHIPEGEKGGYLSSVREAVNTATPWNYEGRFIRPDGKPIWFSGHAVPREEGEELIFYGVLLDITERKQAEEAVRHLRNYLSNIIDSMPSILVGVDRQGCVTQWNKQAERVTGRGFTEVHQQPLERVYTPLSEVLDQIEAAIRDRRVIRKLKVPHRHEDAIRYEDIIIFPLVANGVEGAVIRVDDVTERVRLEEMMIQSEKMLSVGGLAAGMAHEINNPLAGILQNTDVLKNRLLTDLPANRRAAEVAGIRMDALQHYLKLRKLPEMVADIRDSGLRATAIVRNMLSFARKSDRTVANHDIRTLLDRTIELVETDYDMKKHYDFKKIRIKREYAAADLQVPCESGKIQQVFLNLLKNGAEAMSGIGTKHHPAGAQRPPQFIIRANANEKWVQVEIEDNGPGLDAKTRRSLFEPFFTTKPAGQGTGLGLSVSYFIITEDHGGELDVEPGNSGGARFVIRLPKSGKNGILET
jgi:PAS domain S-box-containing protein